MKRQGSAVWQGGGKGSGELTTPSGALSSQPYSVHLRFESEDGRAGTNPEELIAAAHAGCFSMAAAIQFEQAGHEPERLDTDADLTLEKGDAGWDIRAIHLTLRARIPGMDESEFQSLAEKAKETCPVSKVLNADITLDAALQ